MLTDESADHWPGAMARPGILLPLGLCTCCQLLGDAHCISRSSWQTSPPLLVKCGSSMRLSRSLQAHLPSLLGPPVPCTCQPVAYAAVFVSICPLNHSLCEGRSWTSIFVTLVLSTIPGIEKGKYVLIHWSKPDRN